MQGMNKLSGALPPTIMEDGYEEYNDIIYSTCQCSSSIIVSRFGNQTVSANCILHEWIRPAEAMPLHPFARKIKGGARRCPQPRSIMQLVKTQGRFKKRIRCIRKRVSESQFKPMQRNATVLCSIHGHRSWSQGWQQIGHGICDWQLRHCWIPRPKDSTWLNFCDSSVTYQTWYNTSFTVSESTSPKSHRNARRAKPQLFVQALWADWFSLQSSGGRHSHMSKSTCTSQARDFQLNCTQKIRSRGTLATSMSAIRTCNLHGIRITLARLKGNDSEKIQTAMDHLQLHFLSFLVQYDSMKDKLHGHTARGRISMLQSACLLTQVELTERWWYIEKQCEEIHFGHMSRMTLLRTSAAMMLKALEETTAAVDLEMARKST